MRSLKACRPATSASESRNFKSSTYARSITARRLSGSRSDVTSCKLMRSSSFASGISCSFESFDPGYFSWPVTGSFFPPAMGGSRADPPLDSAAGGDPKWVTHPPHGGMTALAEGIAANTSFGVTGVGQEIGDVVQTDPGDRWRNDGPGGDARRQPVQQRHRHREPVVHARHASAGERLQIGDVAGGDRGATGPH